MSERVAQIRDDALVDEKVKMNIYDEAWNEVNSGETGDDWEVQESFKFSILA